MYSKCGAEPASKILINIEACLDTRSVIKSLDINTLTPYEAITVLYELKKELD